MGIAPDNLATASAGSLTHRYLYGPAVKHLFGYCGRPFDAETGLATNHHRWYDATTGQKERSRTCLGRHRIVLLARLPLPAFGCLDTRNQRNPRRTASTKAHYVFDASSRSVVFLRHMATLEQFQDLSHFIQSLPAQERDRLSIDAIYERWREQAFRQEDLLAVAASLPDFAEGERGRSVAEFLAAFDAEMQGRNAGKDK